MIEIRDEQSGDVGAIRDLNRRVFQQDTEAHIVDAVRASGGALLSLVAVEKDRVIGHVLYSLAEVAGVSGAALGPMAVLPERQRQGIGSRLVEAGTRRLRARGCPFIVVVGHADFYPRFGFTPGRARGIRCEWPVPDDVFMVLILDEARMQDVSGMAKYRAEFSTIADGSIEEA